MSLLLFVDVCYFQKVFGDVCGHSAMCAAFDRWLESRVDDSDGV